MKAVVWLGKCVALLLVIVSSASGQDAGRTPGRLRVLTYNIHHGEGTDRRLDLPRIAKVIQSVNPDIVALQEVDRNTNRTDKVDQPKELARLTNLRVVFGDNIAFGGGEYGNAVLTRLPVVSHRNHRLPNYDDGEQRGVLHVTLQHPQSEGRISLFATHLDHRRDDQERVASARAINRLAMQKPDQPALLAGDLNDVPDSRALREFKRVWTWPQEKPLPTIPVAKPTRQIDYVMVRPSSRWKVVEVKVLPEAVASDHRALLAVLELSNR